MDATLVSCLKELEVENVRLKKMSAEERLKSDILQNAMAKLGSAAQVQSVGLSLY